MSIARITDNIYIGSIESAVNTKLLDALGVDCIINLSGYTYNTSRKIVNISMLDVTVSRETRADYIQKFTFGAAMIDNFVKKENKRVLVHCAAGINRSACLIAFYLLRKGVRLADVLAVLKRANDSRGVKLFTNGSFITLLQSQAEEIIRSSPVAQRRVLQVC